METFLSIFSNVLLFTQLPEWPLVSVYFLMNYLLFAYKYLFFSILIA